MKTPLVRDFRTVLLSSSVWVAALGYWALFTTMTSEQFGTDVRGTFTTFIPNLVRAMAIPITLSFAYLKPHFGDLPSMQGIGITIAVLAFTALALLPETFQKDLDFTES